MYTKSKTTKTIILIALIIISTQIATATITIHWQSPSVTNEYIAGYPTLIRGIIQSTTNIEECYVIVDDVVYYKKVDTGNTAIILEKTAKINEGSHTATINCTNTGAETVSESKTFNTSTELNFQEDNTNILKLTILSILFIFLIIIHLNLRKENTYMLICSGGMLLISVYATTLHNEVYMGIPIGISIIWLIDDILKATGLA